MQLVEVSEHKKQLESHAKQLLFDAKYESGHDERHFLDYDI